jgi:tetratricopeptide (TPR) repeat protein
VDPDATLEKLKGVLSRNAQAVLKNTDPEEIEKKLKQGKRLRHEWARGGYLWDIDLDFRLQGTDAKGEGNDAIGYREKLQIPPGGKQMTVFVVKEDGQYKILDSTEEAPNAVGLEILDRLAARDLDGARVLLDWVRDEQHLGGGDDPLSGQPFPRFWAKGKEADANQMKLAAAAILVWTKPAARQGLSILEVAKKAATSDAERTDINVALLTGYESCDDYGKILEVSSELAKQFPESAKAFLSQELAERGLGRFADAQALAEQRLKRIPDDVDAIKALAANAIAQEDYRAAYDQGRKLVDLGKAEASDLNLLAWLTLFFERPQGPDVESALKSSQMRQDSSYTLHTLGCLYAEAGKTKEAYDVLIQAMDLRNLDEPNPDFWYAFGRIAEQYGERDIALSDYAKVTKPKRAIEIPDSSYRLAQIRLKALRNNPPPDAASNADKARNAN